MFRSHMLFSNNKFLRTYEPIELVRKYGVYFGENATVLSTYAMLDELKNASTKQEMFGNKVEFSYYSYSSLCVRNMYGAQGPHNPCSTIYLLILYSILLFPITISFIMLLLHKILYSSSRNDLRAPPVINPNGGPAAPAIPKPDSISTLLIIATQLMSWLTVTSLMAVYRTSDPSQLLYLLTVTLIYPLNCMLNPLLNVCQYSVIWNNVFHKKREVVEEIEMEVRNGEVIVNPVRGAGVNETLNITEPAGAPSEHPDIAIDISDIASRDSN